MGDWSYADHQVGDVDEPLQKRLCRFFMWGKLGKVQLFLTDTYVLCGALLQAPTDYWTSYVVCGAFGMGRHVLHGCYLGRVNGAPSVLNVERGSPPPVSI